MGLPSSPFKNYDVEKPKERKSRPNLKCCSAKEEEEEENKKKKKRKTIAGLVM
jgi:hypothetical protein